MIHLTKQSEPPVLAQNKSAWTQQYLSYISSGQQPPGSLRDHYKDPPVKQAIVTETAGKCAYCESKIRAVYPGDVEHILPKSKCPELIFDWDNLTLACGNCNGAKGDYYNTVFPLINPYVDDMPENLFGSGPCVWHHSKKGEVTVGTVKLNRTGLVERRQEAIESINHLIDRWKEATDPAFKNYLKDMIYEYALSDKEFSFV